MSTIKDAASSIAAFAVARAEIDRLAAENARLRAAIDQAISDLRPMLALTDDPVIEEMIHHCADALSAALRPKETPQ